CLPYNLGSIPRPLSSPARLFSTLASTSQRAVHCTPGTFNMELRLAHPIPLAPISPTRIVRWIALPRENVPGQAEAALAVAANVVTVPRNFLLVVFISKCILGVNDSTKIRKY